MDDATSVLTATIEVMIVERVRDWAPVSLYVQAAMTRGLRVCLTGTFSIAFRARNTRARESMVYMLVVLIVCTRLV